MPEGYFTLQSAVSKKNLDVPNESNDNGAAMIQWQAHNGANQKWQLKVTDGYYYIIKSVSSGKCLDMPTSNEGEKVIQYDCMPNNDNQKWSLQRQSNGSYLIISKRSGKALDVPNSNPNNGVPIVQWTRHGQTNQRWILMRTSYY
jgi:uncharacterized protein YebE (UPF0316 family)